MNLYLCLGTYAAGVSSDELEELKEAFDLFDKDGGGTYDGISTYFL